VRCTENALWFSWWLLRDISDSWMRILMYAREVPVVGTVRRAAMYDAEAISTWLLSLAQSLRLISDEAAFRTRNLLYSYIICETVCFSASLT
jgi:hypothetical protein